MKISPILVSQPERKKIYETQNSEDYSHSFFNSLKMGHSRYFKQQLAAARENVKTRKNDKQSPAHHNFSPKPAHLKAVCLLL
jgi:hypothetical protein